jgi:CelD/BcsL family acetyltransferase involved in cellulose biosynthesis
MIPRLINADQDAFWAATADHRFSSLFSSALWQQAVARTYGFTISAAVRGGGGKGDAALLFSRITDLRGDRIVSGPFCDYCDPLVETTAEWHEIIEPVLALRLPVTLRCLHKTALVQEVGGFTVAGSAASHGVDLTRSEAALWEGFNGSARQNIRKAQRLGVTVREGRSIEDVRAFFDMHCQVRKTKYRLLPQPFTLFEQLHEAFAPEDRITVMLAESAGAVVAGILFLQWGDTLYYKFNASVDRQSCPNDLLMWEGIRMGQRRGLRRLDFGASDHAQPGLLRYKEKYATERGEITRLRWMPPEYIDPRAEEAGKVLSRMTHLLTDPAVPDEITRAAGEALYAQFC